MYKMGYIPDLPDIRDFTADHPQVANLLNKVTPQLDATAAVPVAPAVVDLRSFCPPIVDQGQLGSCTANAAAGIIGYYENKTYGKFNPASRIFIYKATRDLMKQSGDTGATIRQTMQTLATFGSCPESYMPYNTSTFDAEPTAFQYAMANNYKATTYHRLDPAGTAPAQVLTNCKQSLQNGIPFEFGFTVYHSLYSSTNGDIPMPVQNDSVVGGHAIAAVGYDDNHIIGKSRGAFIIRNSWGTTWGQAGYGYLPYDYFTSGLANDCWVILTESFLDVTAFS